MEEIIQHIIDNFDWAYMLSVNVLTYIIIKLLDYINKDKDVKVIVKRIVLISCTIILAILYKCIDADIDNKILLNSAILAPVAWDFVFRPILVKLNINYKNIDKQ